MRHWRLFLSLFIRACPALAFVVGPMRQGSTTTQRQADPQQQPAHSITVTPKINNNYNKKRQLRPSYRRARTNDEDCDDREYAHVRRGRGGGKHRFDDAEEEGDDYYEKGDASRRTTDNPYYRDSDSYDGDEWDFIDDLEDKWDGDLEEMEKHDLLGNVLIPNPLLDNIDPDGAAERFPELAKDPRFWFEIVLFLAFLDFLSFVGPRDPFPDLPLPYGPM